MSSFVCGFLSCFHGFRLLFYQLWVINVILIDFIFIVICFASLNNLILTRLHLFVFKLAVIDLFSKFILVSWNVIMGFGNKVDLIRNVLMQVFLWLVKTLWWLSGLSCGLSSEDRGFKLAIDWPGARTLFSNSRAKLHLSICMYVCQT